RVTSATMSENLRNYDMIGRYGGDEFLLYLPDVSREEAGAIMVRMELKVAEQKIEGFEGAVILDYGIAGCPEDGINLSEVIRIADERMYRYKAERKAVKSE
ncbi:MAG TPA: diguanylate cyclase, partial [Synergistaceae bacterium]|nr:diguanylate cyclase [Synergistaceae bacterium]